MNTSKTRTSKYISDAMEELQLIIEGEDDFFKAYEDIKAFLVRKMKESFKNGVEVGKKSILNPTRPVSYHGQYKAKNDRRG